MKAEIDDVSKGKIPEKERFLSYFLREAYLVFRRWRVTLLVVVIDGDEPKAENVLTGSVGQSQREMMGVFQMQ